MATAPVACHDHHHLSAQSLLTVVGGLRQEPPPPVPLAAPRRTAVEVSVTS
jgi:hypothetical protein